MDIKHKAFLQGYMRKEAKKNPYENDPVMTETIKKSPAPKHKIVGSKPSFSLGNLDWLRAMGSYKKKGSGGGGGGGNNPDVDPRWKKQEEPSFIARWAMNDNQEAASKAFRNMWNSEYGKKHGPAFVEFQKKNPNATWQDYMKFGMNQVAKPWLSKNKGALAAGGIGLAGLGMLAFGGNKGGARGSSPRQAAAPSSPYGQAAPSWQGPGYSPTKRR